jgi:hypothetical protein
MAEIIRADASPEKRLFISLLTRDIPLVAAFLDLIDNSINAAVEPHSDRLKSAEDYMSVLSDESLNPSVDISMQISDKKVEITDKAGGIPAKTAADHVFKFGRAADEAHIGDRLSVYGIGLKRAIFKLGNKVLMTSDNVEGGFDLKLDVSTWAKDQKQPWTFPIKSREKAKPASCGTSIIVTELYDDVRRRVSDGVFEGQLRESIAKTYAFYMNKFVSIDVNGKRIEPIAIEIGENHASEKFEHEGVTCIITAGIGIAQGGGFRERSSGWFVMCNGRAVISADKSPLTGWGSGLPMFQPKHRPFIGTVFFVSEYPEKLPWTTTKSGINEDSVLWQLAKQHMATVGRSVVSFLDSRYTDEGTEVPSKELQDAAGKRVSVLTAAVSQQRFFDPPKRPPPETTRIQYDARIEDVKRITKYLRKSSMSGSDVGRYTFNHFLRNEVGEE